MWSQRLGGLRMVASACPWLHCTRVYDSLGLVNLCQMPFWLGVACRPKALVAVVYVTLVRRYATWAALGGITDLHDSVAAAAGLPQVDSYNMWPMLSGSNGTSPRSEIVVGSHVGGDEAGGTTTVVAALIRPPWKLIVGEGPGDILDMAGLDGRAKSQHKCSSRVEELDPMLWPHRADRVSLRYSRRPTRDSECRNGERGEVE